MTSRAPGRSLLVFAAALLALVTFAGCIEAPLDEKEDEPGEVQPDHEPSGTEFDGEMFELIYTLEDLSTESRMAPHGEHCGPVRKESDRIVAEQYQYEKIVGAEAALYIDPEFKGNWANFGHGPYLLAVPGKIESSDLDETILQFGWSDGKLLVDGEVLTLPAKWTKTAGDGSWRITASLREGSGQIEVVEDQMCM